MPQKKSRFTIGLEVEIAQELTKRAESEGLSRSSYAARIITEALGETKPPSEVPRPDFAESLKRIEDLMRQFVSIDSSTKAPQMDSVPLENEQQLRELADNLPRIHHEIVSRQTLHEQQLKNLRNDLAKAVAVILVSGGKTKPDKARAWVKKHLLQKTESPNSSSPER